MALDGKYGKLDIPGIPDDEPVFIIRGKDLAAPFAVREYASHALDAGATATFANEVEARADEIAVWQRDNPTKTKTPD